MRVRQLPPPSHLYLMARNRLFSGLTVSKTQICWLLSTAANHESDWLLNNVCLHIPEDVYFNPHQRRGFILSRLGGTDVRAKYYFLMASFDPNAHPKLAQITANSGYPPAMSFYARQLAINGDCNADEWSRKAAELGDPDGLYQVANGDPTKLAVAAAHGSIKAMYAIGTDVMHARASFYGGYLNFMMQKRDCQTRFNVGRELVDFEHVWGFPQYTTNVDNVYIHVDEAARRATLLTLYALRPLLGRDVARMIARLVYETRNYDAECWWVDS